MNDHDTRLPSFRSFDYRTRPNKGAERRILVEMFRRLACFEPIENYRYVGLGSVTFTDFILIHKGLNISDMISIENREEYKACFEFNKPFGCVHIEYGEAEDVLTKLTWDKRVIVWLDYEKQITSSAMEAVSYVTSRILPGSMLIVTVNAEGYKTQYKESVERADRRLRKLFKRIANFDLPPNIESKDLQGIEMAKISQRLINDAISLALRDRNGIYSYNDQIKYHPLVNFVYKDGARMLTVGGVFYREHERDILANCKFEDLKFTQKDNDTLSEIRVPVMTPRERHYLEQLLPAGPCNQALDIGLSQDEIENYVLLYRYCPSYAEVELT